MTKMLNYLKKTLTEEEFKSLLTNPREDGSTLLHFVYRHFDSDTINHLHSILDEIFSQNELTELFSKSNSLGQTPLMLAAMNQNSLVIESVLNHFKLKCSEAQLKEILTQEDKHGFTPLHYQALAEANDFDGTSSRCTKREMIEMTVKRIYKSILPLAFRKDSPSSIWALYKQILSKEELEELFKKQHNKQTLQEHIQMFVDQWEQFASWLEEIDLKMPKGNSSFAPRGLFRFFRAEFMNAEDLDDPELDLFKFKLGLPQNIFAKIMKKLLEHEECSKLSQNFNNTEIKYFRITIRNSDGKSFEFLVDRNKSLLSHDKVQKIPCSEHDITEENAYNDISNICIKFVPSDRREIFLKSKSIVISRMPPKRFPRTNPFLSRFHRSQKSPDPRKIRK